VSGSERAADNSDWVCPRLAVAALANHCLAPCGEQSRTITLSVEELMAQSDNAGRWLSGWLNRRMGAVGFPAGVNQQHDGKQTKLAWLMAAARLCALCEPPLLHCRSRPSCAMAYRPARLGSAGSLIVLELGMLVNMEEVLVYSLMGCNGARQYPFEQTHGAPHATCGQRTLLAVDY
jgi:hypothetical protein